LAWIRRRYSCSSSNITLHSLPVPQLFLRHRVTAPKIKSTIEKETSLSIYNKREFNLRFGALFRGHFHFGGGPSDSRTPVPPSIPRSVLLLLLQVRCIPAPSCPLLWCPSRVNRRFNINNRHPIRLQTFSLPNAPNRSAYQPHSPFFLARYVVLNLISPFPNVFLTRALQNRRNRASEFAQPQLTPIIQHKADRPSLWADRKAAAR
jgi:hypothetical protein